MRRLIRSILLILLISVMVTSCYTGKKNLSELGGLMLLENTQLSRNKAYYSKHNKKVKKNVHSKYKKAVRKNNGLRHSR